MQRCWKYIPVDRPTFTTLQKCFIDYKYSPSNYITFRVVDTDSQTDYGDNDSGMYLFCPPKEVTKHFNRLSQSGIRKSDPWYQDGDPWNQDDGDPWNQDEEDPWNQDETLSRSEIALHCDETSTSYSSDGSQSEEDEEPSCEHVEVQIEVEDIPQPARDRRQKRTLTMPALFSNGSVANSSENQQKPPSHDKSRRIKSWNVNEEKHSSRLFVADQTDPFLAPAYRELMIPSQSESSLDNNDDSSQKHQYSYAYP